MNKLTQIHGSAWLSRSTGGTLSYLRSEIEVYLRQFSDQEVLFFAPPGNGGDCLIACGTYCAFDRLHIKEHFINENADVSGKTVIVCGSGNLVPNYREKSTALTKFSPSAKRIVVLPSTIRNQDQLLQSLGDNVTIFCRDFDSFDYIRSLNTRFDLRLAHDMCFHVDPDSVLGDKRLTLTVSETWAFILKKNGFLVDDLANKEALRVIRGDSESGQTAVKPELDISSLFSFGSNRHYAFAGAWCMLKTITLVKQIITDRLHVSLGSAIVGTNCTLMDNSYGKNRAVFLHSVQGRFPNVKFAEVSENSDTVGQSEV